MRNKDLLKSQAKKFKIDFKNGRFEIPGADAWHKYWREPYYLLLTIPWWGFLSLAMLFYLTVNALFAIGFMMGGKCIENGRCWIEV